jgi:hypothetical protein
VEVEVEAKAEADVEGDRGGIGNHLQTKIGLFQYKW